MKKTILVLSLMLTVSAGTLFAGVPDPVTEVVKAAFKKEFPQAKIIGWSTTGDYIRATFILAGFRSEAYFNDQGVLFGSIRNIFYTQLPLAVTQAIEKRYADTDVVQVSEITNGNGTRYLLDLRSEKCDYQVQFDAGGNTLAVEKQKK